MSFHVVDPVTIPEFFENKNVFITGSTGFIGRLLVEKLLRECPGIKNIYVLLRPKRRKNVQDRIKDIIDIPIFDHIRKTDIKALDKIIAVAGNVEEIDFGLSEEDRQTIINNVSIIFHLAASVRFSDSLKKSIRANIRSAREAALLATQLKNPEVFLDTSTAYCNSDHLIVEEKLYPPKMDWQKLLQIGEESDDTTLDHLIHKIIYPMPNTYTFTKAIAEHAVADTTRGKVPTVIARPSIVKPTIVDPFPGWVDNLNGSVGLLYGIGRGVTRVLYGRADTFTDQVFADNVVKAMIVAAWQKALSGDADELTIHNMTSDISYSMGDEISIGNKFMEKYPFSYYLWPSKGEVYHNFYRFYITMVIKHLLPAVLVDSILSLTNRKPTIWKIQRKTYLANVHLFYFMTNSWNFINNNYQALMNCMTDQDREAFKMVYYGPKPDKKIVKENIEVIYLHGRKHLFNEPVENMSRPIIVQRLLYVEKAFKLFLVGMVLYLIFVRWQFIPSITNGIYNYFDKLC